MKNAKIIAIGDNVCDKYLSRGKMYPGGQCVNTCAYVKLNDTHAAYLGKFGNDAVARYNQITLDALGVDRSHCRAFDGENGFALVTLNGKDRVFLGSNKGGIAKDNPFAFTQEDLDYIRNFQMIYTNLNSYIEDDLCLLSSTGVPIAFDFSVRWTDEYLEQVCPYIQIALLSCAHLSKDKRESEMRKVAALGVPIVLGTIGERGSYALYNNTFFYTDAVHADNVVDTMGAGDSYFAAFLCHLLKKSATGVPLDGTPEENAVVLKEAMSIGASFAAKVCAMEGAFGYGTEIVGKINI